MKKLFSIVLLYSLTVLILSGAAAQAGLLITNVALIPGNIVLSGSGGSSNASYYLLANGTLAASSTNWPVLATNQFDASGRFLLTNPLPPGQTARFYRLRTAPAVTSSVPDFSMIGYATSGPGTTGGAGGSTVTVSNVTSFRSALNMVGPMIVQVEGMINIGNTSINRANKTILGLGTNAALIGNMTFNGASNIIVRNLFLSYPGGSDGISIQGFSRQMWIDHCSFGDCGDGQIDITHGADFITVSWCKFSYTPAQTAHRFSSLVGHDENNAAEDVGRLHITYHHNWWSTLCTERMPRARFGRIHVFNNYFNSPGNNYCVRASIQSELLVQNNYFDNIDSPYEKFVELGETGLINATGDVIVNCTSVQSFNDPVFTPPYAYTAEAPAGIPAVVTNNTGAGMGPFAP